VLGGRYLVRPALRIIAKTGMREIFTAFALLLVIAIALLMQWVGMSMALGAFMAGVLLADSEYRHALETDLEPFKGLLLGLFFIAVGMSVDFGVFLAQPLADPGPGGRLPGDQDLAVLYRAGHDLFGIARGQRCAVRLPALAGRRIRLRGVRRGRHGARCSRGAAGLDPGGGGGAVDGGHAAAADPARPVIAPRRGRTSAKPEADAIEPTRTM
jgi:hypothetical protein